MEIDGNWSGGAGSIALFGIMVVAICIIVIVYINKYPYGSKAWILKINILILIFLIAKSHAMLSDIDYIFNTTRVDIIVVDEVELSANMTKIHTADSSKVFRISTSREQDSILLNYFAGHLCEIEYAEFSRTIIRIKVIE